MGAGRYGFSDYEWKGRGALSYRRASGAGFVLDAYDDHALAGDELERSLFVNSLAAQEFGSDHTNPFGVRGYSASALAPSVEGWRASLTYAVEAQRPLAVRATPAFGDFGPTIRAGRFDERRVEVVLERPTHLTFGGLEARYRFEGAAFRFSRESAGSRPGRRASLAASFERPLGADRFVARITAAALYGQEAFTFVGVDPSALPDVVVPPLAPFQPQHLVYFGGPVTGPGYDFHQFVGTSGASARVEWRTPVPFPSVSLGRFGRAPGRMTLAPYVNVVAINGGAAAPRRGHGLYPSIGLGALTIFDILRVDVARGLRNGRWTMSIDLNRDFWPVL